MVGEPCSENKESSREVTLFSTFLQDAFPLYLFYGMTYEQFWCEDCSLADYYRKAYELRRAEENQKLWLQGVYFYVALCDVAPLYSWKPQKPQDYLSEPIPLSEKEKEKQDERKQSEAIKEYMNTFMVQFNKEKEG